MNNLLLCCGLVDAGMSASEKDLPVLQHALLHIILGSFLKFFSDDTTNT